jgi:hypothetical protein
MLLDDALQQAVSNIPECLAAGYVDLTTGMLVGIHSVDSHPQEVMDLVAAATADMFQCSNVIGIENAYNKARGTQPIATSQYCKEVVVLSEHLIHVFLRSRKNQEQVAGFVCRKSTNLGIALTRSRQAMDAIEAAD